MDETLGPVHAFEQATPCQQAAKLEFDYLVNGDTEAWVKARIATAVRMALALRDQMRVGADNPTVSAALDGIVNGAAVAVIETMGRRPSFVNLRDAHWF